MNMPEIGDSTVEAVAARLVLLRTALDFGEGRQAAFAERLGLMPPRYNNYETGLLRPPIAVALKIAREFGVSLDWLYNGRMELLPLYIAQKLEQPVTRRRRARKTA